MQQLQTQRWHNVGSKPLLGALALLKDRPEAKQISLETFRSWRKCVYTQDQIKGNWKYRQKPETRPQQATNAYNETMSNTCLIHFLACIPIDNAKTYHEWVVSWKREYANLSLLIRECKQMRKSSLNDFNAESMAGNCRDLRQLANKMLMARFTGKVARRSFRHLTNI